jgi:glucoamylase
MWLDGRAYWPGNQLDETAFPLLLADRLRRARALGDLDPWPMVRRAASYLARNGPVTPQDRWEEDGGYSTFTLAVTIAALLAAADFAAHRDDRVAAAYLRETADIWNQSIESWTYVTGTPLAARADVSGYYVRIAPPGVDGSGGHGDGPSTIPLRNQSTTESDVPYDGMISPDSLALVRFGLRAPNDERIVNTVRAIDLLLRTETVNGPVWHRYNEDGYGEHADGSPFDGSGIGRGWPLLAGERGHYELAAGRTDQARFLLDVMRRQSGLGGLIPEQVWDEPDIPGRSLFAGCPTGSAMPLAWAHAEFVKLARSIEDGRVFDTPPQTLKRYVTSHHKCRKAMWRFNNKARAVDAGYTLRIEAQAPFVAHWTCDEWRTIQDTRASDTTLGVWLVDLPTDGLPVGRVVRFTFFWPESNRWEGTDFAVVVRHPRKAP